MKTIAIIGGGAAGLAAAVSAALEIRCVGGFAGEASNARVVVFERDERVGRSILATGNGRCNFSNAHIDPAVYHNAEFVEAALVALEAACSQGRVIARGDERFVEHFAPARFGGRFDSLHSDKRSTDDSARCSSVHPANSLVEHLGKCEGECESLHPNAVQAFFANLGLVWREEAEGRMYPYANKASSVLDVLRNAALALDVEMRCNAEVSLVDPPRKECARFTLKLKDGSFERADAVIIACGGNVARELLPVPLPFAHPRTVLGPLSVREGWVKQLDNIRVRGVARLVRNGCEVARETGEVLFRKYGLSGIAVFNLSRHALEGDVLKVDMLPFLEDEQVEAFALRRYDGLHSLCEDGLTCGRFLQGLVLPQVARVVLKEKGFDEDDCLSRDAAVLVVQMFRCLAFKVCGVADARQCQVHRGGFLVGSVSAHTMESSEIDGLFIAGEALDVDAPCGGYNLHWAWASGMLAGVQASRRVLGVCSDSGAAGCFEAGAAKSRGGSAGDVVEHSRKGEVSSLC